MLLDMLQHNYDALRGHSLKLTQLLHSPATESGLVADNEAQSNLIPILPSSLEWMK
jgi:hypothetical protein